MKRLFSKMITGVLAAQMCLSVMSSDVKVNGGGIYVPVSELPRLIEPDDKAVLMKKDEFDKLAAEAKAAEKDSGFELAEIENGEYEIDVNGEKAFIKGKLSIVSTFDKAVFVELGFGGFGLDSVKLEGAAAPLGYNDKGQAGVIVKGSGSYSLEITGALRLKELASGGMHFGIRIPEAVSGRMNVRAAGDVEVHSSVPSSKGEYSSKEDKTSSVLTVGGVRDVTVILLGNGRREGESSILLGNRASTITLSKRQEVVSCLYTVHVLRRSVKELSFTVPGGWTVTDVVCSGLVKWSIAESEPGSQKGRQILNVRFSSNKKGEIVFHVKGTASRDGDTWQAGGLQLENADFERGYLMVITDQELGVRGENIANARREDVSSANYITGLASAAGARLYFTWGRDWEVSLSLVDVELRRSVEEKQRVIVDRGGVKLLANFDITAVDRQMFLMRFDIAGESSNWDLVNVTVDGKKTGFQWRVEKKESKRELTIELPKGVETENFAKVSVVMQHVPVEWDWSGEKGERSLSVPLIGCKADMVSGVISVATADDLSVTSDGFPTDFEPLGAGKMSEMGFAGNVKFGYSYKKPAEGVITVKVSRLTGRIAADSVGVISAGVRQVKGKWRINYTITRGRVKELYLLADKELGEALSISCGSVEISSKSIVKPGEDSYSLSGKMAEKYNLWELVLDERFIGKAVVDVEYEYQAEEGKFLASLIRPVCGGDINEMLAVNGSEEIALGIEAAGIKEIDAIDLPELPMAVTRILGAYRLSSLNTDKGEFVSVELERVVYENYDIVKTVVLQSVLTSYVDVDGGQRVEGVFRVANAGRQFLTMKLPEGAALWSLRVDGKTVKPQRSSGGELQVAIGKIRKPVNVKVVFSCESDDGDLKRVALGGVEFDGVEINDFTWKVIPPVGHKVVAQETDMDMSVSTRVEPAYKSLISLLSPRFMFFMPSLGKCSKPGLDFGGGAIESITGAANLEDSQMPMEMESKKMEFNNQQKESQQQLAKGPQQQRAFGVRLRAEGGRTLPVDLVGVAGAGPMVKFTGIGPEELVVEFGKMRLLDGWFIAGVLFSIALAVYLMLKSAVWKVRFVFLVMIISSLVTTWVDIAVAGRFANGIFAGAVAAAAGFVIFGVVRGVFRWIGLIEYRGAVGKAAAVVVLAVILSLTGQAEAGRSIKTASGDSGRSQKWAEKGFALMGYDNADANDVSNVLVPYGKYVQLWNAAHPEDRIEVSSGAGRITIAGVRYDVKVGPESAELVLRGEVKVHGKNAGALVLDFAKLAVQEVMLGGKEASVGVNESGQTVLIVEGGFNGELLVRAVGKCEYFGRRGNISFSIPVLPGGVMKVELPMSDLELEVDGIEGVVEQVGGKESVMWRFAPGMKRDISLQWVPRMGGSGTDKTLSAVCASEVYAFHWAMPGVTKINYSCSGGEHDRFAFLIPEGVAITDVSGKNLKDWEATGEKTVEGKKFRYVRVRLHRAAKKNYELVVRWLSPLGELEKAGRLYLVRAADVSRESGTVTLYEAGGMKVKVASVSGGRRTSLDTGNGKLAAESTRPVARYYWPYRPFMLSVEMFRDKARANVRLDQLVRLEDDRVQLLVEADMESTAEKLFGASFLLPDGYELLSVAGGAVERYYQQRKEGDNLVHVKLFSGENKTKLAMVLVSSDPNLSGFEVPVVKFSSSYGIKADRYWGRIAVQPAAAMEGVTVKDVNVKTITPLSLEGWLDREQINGVQFAWKYENADPGVRLNIRRKETRKGVEVFAGMAVKPTAVWYTYRLRYMISGSPVDSLSFSMPSEYSSLAEVTSPAMRSVEKAEGNDKMTRWTVNLLSEVTGTVDVAVNLSIPIDESTSQIVLPKIETGSKDNYRVIAAVQNMSRHSMDIADDGVFGLEVMSVSEQQKYMGAQMRQTLQYVFESFDEQWSLRLNFKAAKRAARMKVVVDLLAMTTVVDRDGSCRYEARITIQNRSKQFLRIKADEKLRLWSASVAGRPVKPVVSEDLESGEVLIPLVKTSPGGLPYDVHVYYAGRAVEKFSTVSKLTPPAISIAEIPVSRTTWSLRLPSGYKYMRYGGNMSVAGQVEMISVGIESDIDVLERLDKAQRQFGTYSSNIDEAAKKNFEVLNKKLEQKIEQTEQYLKFNRGSVGKDDYSRLAGVLSRQKASQERIMIGNAAYNNDVLMNEKNDLIGWINSSNTSAGFTERERNRLLNDKPKFVGDNESRQVESLKSQLQLGSVDGDVPVAVPNAPDTLDSFVSVSDSGEKMEKQKQILKGVSRFNAKQMDAKAAQVRKQLSQISNNRASRHFAKNNIPKPSVAKSRTVQSRGVRNSGRPSTHDYSMKKEGGYGGARFDSTVRENSQVGGIVDGLFISEPVISAEVSMDAYVSHGTYSLPVSLPVSSDAVQIDFSRPSGGASVSIWAVDGELVSKIYGTAVIVVSLLVLLVVCKFWPCPESKKQMNAKRVIGYVLLLGLFTVLLGFLGLVAAMVLAAVLEASRGAFVENGLK